MKKQIINFCQEPDCNKKINSGQLFCLDHDPAISSALDVTPPKDDFESIGDSLERERGISKLGAEE